MEAAIFFFMSSIRFSAVLFLSTRMLIFLARVYSYLAQKSSMQVLMLSFSLRLAASLMFLHSSIARKHLCFSSLIFSLTRGYSHFSLWSKMPLLPIPSVTTTMLLPAPCWLTTPSPKTMAGPSAVCPCV